MQIKIKKELIKLEISIEEIQILIDCVGCGLGEGFPSCYKADEYVIPEILTRHKMICLEFDGGVKVLPASEFFSEDVNTIASKAFQIVFDRQPSQDDLLKALNYTPSEYKDFLPEMKPCHYSVEQFVRYFKKAKERLTED